jgi:hypothetical protein
MKINGYKPDVSDRSCRLLRLVTIPIFAKQCLQAEAWVSWTDVQREHHGRFEALIVENTPLTIPCIFATRPSV